MTDNKTNTDGALIPWCLCENKNCRGNVKPDIVFFGENLPRRYFDLRETDLEEADLLIVIGTSLKVTPFSDTMHFCNVHAPRLLINLEEVGVADITSNGHGFLFNTAENYRDVALLGTCDEGILILSELLGWRDELEKLIRADNGSWKSPIESYELLETDYRVTQNFHKNTTAIKQEASSQQDEITREIMKMNSEFANEVNRSGLPK